MCLQCKQELGAKIAMHVVAARPLCLDRQSVPEEALAAERGILKEQAAKSGKPPAIIERMVTGRLHKVRCALLTTSGEL